MDDATRRELSKINRGDEKFQCRRRVQISSTVTQDEYFTEARIEMATKLDG